MTSRAARPICAASRSSLPSSRARRRRITSDDAVKKRASRRLSQASWHRALAMWVLPVPTSPMSTRSSRRSRNESESRSSRPRPSSWLGSGFALPPRTRESEQSPRRRERRERKLARHLARQAGGRVKSEGRAGSTRSPPPRGLQGRRLLRGGRRPAGVVTNICFMPSTTIRYAI